jgi:aminoglycoside phosphotransferase (APT) family kinase protein
MHGDDQVELRALLAHLSVTNGEAHRWRAWQIVPVAGGANNRLQRATTTGADLAIKWTLRDERDRAGREYAALAALQSLGLDLAPSPLLLDRTSYPLPVVVQTWLPGETRTTPPVTDAEWTKLLEHYAAIHQVIPDRLTRQLPAAVLTADSVHAARRLVEWQLQQLPIEARPGVVQRLIRRLDAWEAPTWPSPLPTLLRTDPNIRNFVQCPTGWMSVDWENSGWGDPAFEIADLITHAAYLDVEPARWTWVVQTYAMLRGEPSIATRITAYRVCLLVWWAARLARMLYEVPRGHDKRLALRPPDWLADATAKLEHYVADADAALREVGV